MTHVCHRSGSPTSTLMHVMALLGFSLPSISVVAVADERGGPIGACCEGFRCYETTEEACINNNGAFLGEGTTCPAPTCREGGACGAPGTGSCYETQNQPGCKDAQCCLIVCSTDPFCCELLWDGVCAAVAEKLCAVCASPPAGPMCREDFSGDGVVDGADLGLLLGSWNATNVISQIDLNHDLVVDGDDLGLLLAAWGPCVGTVVQENEPCGESTNGGCSAPAASGSDCCVAHDDPGCSNIACEHAVCVVDPDCCDVEWESSCAVLADQMCDPLCDPAPREFQPIASGQTVHGTIAVVEGVKSDWYEFTLDQPSFVTWIVSAQSSAVSTSIFGGECPASQLGAFTESPAGPCTLVRLGYCLAPGTYRVTVELGLNDHFPCDNGLNAYAAMLHVEPSDCTPSADDCADALPIAEGDTLVNTVGAKTDGPPLGGACGTSTTRDVWFLWEAPSNGALTVSTCNSATFNTKLAVYAACNPLSCPALASALLACNNDAPGCGQGSVVVVPVVQGNCYKIRVAGSNSSSGVAIMHVEHAPARR